MISGSLSGTAGTPPLSHAGEEIRQNSARRLTGRRDDALRPGESLRNGQPRGLCACDATFAAHAVLVQQSRNASHTDTELLGYLLGRCA